MMMQMMGPYDCVGSKKFSAFYNLPNCGGGGKIPVAMQCHAVVYLTQWGRHAEKIGYDSDRMYGSVALLCPVEY